MFLYSGGFSTNLFFGFWCFFGSDIVHAEDGQGDEYLRRNENNIRSTQIDIFAMVYINIISSYNVI